MDRLTAPYTAFGKTKNVPVVVHRNGYEVPLESWHKTLWVERPEDYYALMSTDYKGLNVRIITKDSWLRSETISE